MTAAGPGLPDGIIWIQRPFPNCNFVLLSGDEPALVDSGFAGHAEATAALARQHCDGLAWVVNTHWHSDHVGANALLQRAGAAVVGSHIDAAALDERSPGCCVAEYLDQPVPQYTVDRRIAGGDRLLLGDMEWEVSSVPGHTLGHIALWNQQHRVLAAGDTVSTYDVGWVNIMRDGRQTLDTMLSSLSSLRELDARLILPGHGPVIDRPVEALDKAIERIRRQRANLDLAVNYGAKRILAFALMIRGGMSLDALDGYLNARAWVHDAARTLDTSADDFARNLVESMVATGALSTRHGAVRASAESTPVDQSVFDLPYPREWKPSPDAAVDPGRRLG